MTNTSWSKFQKKYNLSKKKYILLLKEKEDPEDLNTDKRENKPLNRNLLLLILIWKLNKHVIICFLLGNPYNMALLMLLGYLMCNVLLAWAMLQQPYLSKSLSSPPPQNPNNWVHSVIFKPKLKIQLTCSSYKVTSFFRFSTLFTWFSIHQ